MRKRFKGVQSSIARHAAWMMSGAVFQAATAFLANLVLVRILLPEDFGRFAIVMANIGLAQSIISIPIGTVVLRTPKDELKDKLSLYAAANVVQNLVGLIAASTILYLINKLDIKASLLLVSSLSTNWISMQINLYERNFRYKNLSLLETIAHSSGHIFAVIGALLGIGSIVLYARELVRQGSLILGLKYIRGIQPIPLRWLKLRDWQELFKQVRAFWLDGFLESSFGRLVILTVGIFSGETGAGYFFQAQRLAILPHQFLQPFSQRMAINYFSHRNPADGQKSFLIKSLKVIFGFLTLAIVLMALGIPLLVPMIFGEVWRPVVAIFFSMNGYILSATLFNLLKSYFIAKGKMHILMLLGRSGQYFGFAFCSLLVFLKLYSNPLIGLGIALSASYMLATMLLLTRIFLFNKLE
ncbi:MAG: oligosaccharide flippase family protein [Elainellaceae cyanobacterium]